MSELEEALGLVVNRLAHDAKNPLAAILSNLRYLRMSVSGEEEREAIQESLVAAERIDRLLDDVSDLQRLRGQQTRSSAPAVLDELEPLLREKLELQMGRRRLVVDLPSARLQVDSSLLQRVLLNLLEHASRNTPSGGTILLAGTLDPEPRLEVTDGGQPFSPNATPSFLSGNLESRVAPKEGCRSDQGLGLFFAGVAARALGARTDVQRRPDGEAGLVFSLTFAQQSQT
jgi:K+-sensing histidine kinase KdpD